MFLGTPKNYRIFRVGQDSLYKFRRRGHNGGQKNKNVKTENVPLSCGYMDQVENNSLKDCIVLINT